MQLQKRESSGDGGSYLKIKDGESVTGVFRGEIHSFKIKWVNNKSVVVDDPNKTRHNRYKANFVLREGIGFVSKTWEFGNSVYDQLYDISTELTIPETKIKITRRGSGMDTSYTLVPLGAVEPGSMNQISNVKLNILNGETVDEGPQWAPESGEDSIPF